MNVQSIDLKNILENNYVSKDYNLKFFFFFLGIEIVQDFKQNY
jgi:hypothetical protein